MKHADALSRNPVMTIQQSLTHKIQMAQQSDEALKSIILLLKAGSEYNNFILKNDVLYKIITTAPLLVIPRKMKSEII